MSTNSGWPFSRFVFLLVCLNAPISGCESGDSSEKGKPENENTAPVKHSTVWTGEDTGYNSEAGKEKRK